MGLHRLHRRQQDLQAAILWPQAVEAASPAAAAAALGSPKARAAAARQALVLVVHSNQSLLYPAPALARVLHRLLCKVATGHLRWGTNEPGIGLGAAAGLSRDCKTCGDVASGRRRQQNSRSSSGTHTRTCQQQEIPFPPELRLWLRHLSLDDAAAFPLLHLNHVLPSLKVPSFTCYRRSGLGLGSTFPRAGGEAQANERSCCNKPAIYNSVTGKHHTVNVM